MRIKYGDNETEFSLNRNSDGLLITPMVWAEQITLSEEASLLVLCNEEIDESDYIREMTEYEREFHRLNTSL